MTLLEIFNEVCRIVTGDIASSPAAVSDQVLIQNDILDIHHSVQQDYNYWFMYLKTTLSLIADTDTYALPANYKSYIYLETSNRFEMLGNDLYFPDGITTTEDVRFDYCAYTLTPAWNDTYTDIVTTKLNRVIIYTVVSNLFLQRAEMTQAQLYAGKAEEHKTLAQQEDFARRQQHLTTW